MGIPLERYETDKSGRRYWDDFRQRPLAFLRQHQPDYEDAVYLAKHWPKKFAVPGYFTAGDPNYGGSLLGQANLEYWRENFGDTESKTWWDLGNSGILVRLDLATKDQQEALDSLEGYPLLDEDAHSHLEQEAQDEAWKDWGRDDFKKETVKLADKDEQDLIEEFFDKITDKEFDKEIWELFRSAENYPEGGDDVRFPSAKEIFDKPDWQKTIEPWDHSLIDLLRFFPDTLAKLKVDIALADAAYGPWKTVNGEKTRTLRITPRDLPAMSVQHREALLRGGGFNTAYDEELCTNLYIECTWDFSSIGLEASEANEAKEGGRRRAVRRTSKRPSRRRR